MNTKPSSQRGRGVLLAEPIKVVQIAKPLLKAKAGKPAELTQKFRHRWYHIRPGLYGNPCGYVQLDEYDIPELQNLCDTDFAKVDNQVSMHGGCTYIGPLPGKAGTWIGFDANNIVDNETTQNMQFCVDECCELIIQLNQLQEVYYQDKEVKPYGS